MKVFHVTSRGMPAGTALIVAIMTSEEVRALSMETVEADEVPTGAMVALGRSLVGDAKGS